MTIKNSMINKIKGYTIVELLAVISILIVISGIITGILYSTLRGSNKVKITTEVSQNGTYALGYMTKVINDSRNVTAINGSTLESCSSNPPPSTANVTPTPAGNAPAITFKRLDGSTTTFKCTSTDITADGVSLLNTDQIQSSVASCRFSCTQLADDLYSLPVIDIEFELGDKNATLGEARASTTFKTSVVLKNYLP